MACGDDEVEIDVHVSAAIGALDAHVEVWGTWRQLGACAAADFNATGARLYWLVLMRVLGALRERSHHFFGDAITGALHFPTRSEQHGERFWYHFTGSFRVPVQ